MNEPEDANGFQGFERAWRESLAGPTRLTAGEGVRRAIEIAQRRRRRRAAGWTLAAAATLAAVALSLGRGTGFRPPESAAPSPAPVAVRPDVVVMWLDAETPLYMALAPDAGAPGGR